MGRLARWLLQILTAALAPLVSRIGDIHQQGLAFEIAADRNHGAIQGALDRLADVPRLLREIGRAVERQGEVARELALRGLEESTDLSQAIRGQTEALRAWEDALLGRVQTIADELAGKHEAVAAGMQAQQAGVLAAAPFIGGLARVLDPAEVAVAESVVTRIGEDARLDEQRPDLRRKVAVGDIMAAVPECPEWRADLLAALCHARMKGRI